MRLSIQSAVQPETFTLRNSVSRLALMTGLVVTISATLAVDAMATEATKSENPAAGEQVVRTPALLIQAAPDGTDYNVSATSSPKQTAPLLDTPQTINVIPQEVIREQGARNLTEVLKNTPGISFNAGENGFATSTNNFSLRGFDASGSIFIDGSRDSGSYSRDIFNIEQVEVVKGAAMSTWSPRHRTLKTSLQAKPAWVLTNITAKRASAAPSTSTRRWTKTAPSASTPCLKTAASRVAKQPKKNHGALHLR
jgi:outer membrane receptor for monomeric catechols